MCKATHAPIFPFFNETITLWCWCSLTLKVNHMLYGVGSLSCIHSNETYEDQGRGSNSLIKVFGKIMHYGGAFESSQCMCCTVCRDMWWSTFLSVQHLCMHDLQGHRLVSLNTWLPPCINYQYLEINAIFCHGECKDPHIKMTHTQWRSIRWWHAWWCGRVGIRQVFSNITLLLEHFIGCKGNQLFEVCSLET